MGFTSQFALPPYFFDSTVTGNNYDDVITHHVIQFLKSKQKLSKTWFQQDGAPRHIFHKVKKTLSDNFKNRIISRHFDMPWPARSPDLKAELIKFMNSINQRVLAKAVNNFSERFEEINNNGGMFLK